MNIVTVGILIFIASTILLPIYLPFIISFTIRSDEWKAVRYALRIAPLLSLFIWFGLMATSPDYGNDIAGNMRGAEQNIIYIWTSGFVALACGLITALIFKAVQKSNEK